MIPLRRTFGRLPVGFARRRRRCIADDLASLGLSDAVWAPFVHLRLSGLAMRHKDLAEAIGLGGSRLVRVIDGLERRDLLQRVVDPADVSDAEIDVALSVFARIESRLGAGTAP